MSEGRCARRTASVLCVRRQLRSQPYIQSTVCEISILHSVGHRSYPLSYSSSSLITLYIDSHIPLSPLSLHSSTQHPTLSPINHTPQRTAPRMQLASHVQLLASHPALSLLSFFLCTRGTLHILPLCEWELGPIYSSTHARTSYEMRSTSTNLTTAYIIASSPAQSPTPAVLCARRSGGGR